MFYTALVRSWYGLGIAMTPSLTRIRHNNTKKPRRLVRLGVECSEMQRNAVFFTLHLPYILPYNEFTQVLRV